MERLIMCNRIKKYIWDIIINGILASYFIPLKLREMIYKLVGIKIGKSSAIHAKCYISGKKLTVGENSYINKDCLIDSYHDSIYIGNNVGIAYKCQLLTTNHNYSDQRKRTGKVWGKSVIIEDGVWLGVGVIVLPGVKIEEGVVVAAGSVVIDNCERNFLYAGKTKKKIKKI